MAYVNPLRQRLLKRETSYGLWVTTESPTVTEVAVAMELDWVCIDMQHGVVDYQVALTMLQAIGTTETIPIVRVPWNEPGIIGKVLDAGAMGVIIPMVNSVEEAKAAALG